MNSQRKPRQQYGALPWRRAPDVQILLVTSRRTARWVIPKGWPIAGLPPHEAAVQEAFEEAGVIAGEVDRASIGHFEYLKEGKEGSQRMCRVDVFALKVTAEADVWPENTKRTRRWFDARAAANEVAEPGLKALILKFAVDNS
jgi:8-oxo-dGTP pyrophosphatase MutT (NUDIX family)